METPQTNNLPPAIVGKFNIAKTEAGFQNFADRESKLVYNEDNIVEIKKYLDDLDKLENKFVSVHKEGKAEAWKICTEWDSALRVHKAQVESLKIKPKELYNKLCIEVTRKKQQQQFEAERIKNIKDGIDRNLVDFSTKIANCTTNEQLIVVERLINLEKGNKVRYQEFLPDFVERAKKLTELITSQKEAIKEMETLNKQKLEAEQSGNDREFIAIEEKEAILSSKIEERKIITQETAISQAIASNPIVEVARQVFADIKSRKTWKWEIADEKKAFQAGMLTTEINTTKAKEALNVLKETQQLLGKEEITVGGIRYFLDTKY